MLKTFKTKVALSLFVGVPLVTVAFSQFAMGGGWLQLRDRQGGLIVDQLDVNDKITIPVAGGDDIVYLAGPAYSPKQTCGECHDYNAITQAYHFMQGGKPGTDGMGLSDTWSSENQDRTSYKYLANAYGHFVSGGQFGAW